MSLPVSELPPRLIVDLSARCNLACSGCLLWNDSVDAEKQESVNGVMDVERARKIFDEVSSTQPIVQPTMWGEPLLIPDLRERIRDMTSRGITVALNTNGLTLTPAIAEMLVNENVSAVFFSIDAVTRPTLKAMRGIDKLEKIEAAVFRLLAARGNRELPRIGVSFTVQAGNRHEEQEFINRWSAAVDVVRIGQVFDGKTFLGPTPKGPRKPCPAIYSTMAVHSEGTCSICCLDTYRTNPMGNVFADGGVKAVWHGEKFTAARKAHEDGDVNAMPSLCRECSGWDQHSFTERTEGNWLVRESSVYTYYNDMRRMGNWTAKRGATPSFKECIGEHPERRGTEPPQAAQRPDIVREIFKQFLDRPGFIA